MRPENLDHGELLEARASVEERSTDSGKAAELRVAGDVRVDTVALLFEALLRALTGAEVERITVDFERVTALDSSGIAALSVVARRATDAGIGFSVVGVSDDLAKVMALMPYQSTLEQPPAVSSNPIEWLGGFGLFAIERTRHFYDTATDTAFAFARLAKGRFPPKGSVATQCVRIGVDALPIVTLLSLLLGLVLAFQAADQLRSFGANIYTADIVGIGMFREFGPILTGIVLAGRSGSAMAAELGTMRVNEEVDALQTMGIDPNRFLTVPRILAIVIVQPALTLLSDLVGAAGGLLIGTFYLNIPARGYINQSLLAIQPSDLFEGLAKSVVFAAVIGLVGCYFGLSVRGGATGVGRATTSAVVASIFLIIVTDSIFTTLSTFLR